MTIDEIQALKAAIDVAPSDEWLWQPMFFISLNAGEWHVHIERECVVRISQTSGSPIRESSRLDPATALSIARSYAADHSLAWKPSFSLQLGSSHWIVGSCQSQFGGQTSINVSHQGVVLGHSVNPK